MDILVSTFLGLSFRFLVDVVSSQNTRVAGMLIGLWEGVVLHYLSRSAPSHAYIAYGLRVSLDLILADNLSRIWLIVLWTALGMLISDAVGPSHWYDTTKHTRGVHRTRGRHDRIPSLHKNPHPADTSASPRTPSQTQTHKPSASLGSIFTKASIHVGSRDITAQDPDLRFNRPDISKPSESSRRELISRSEDSEYGAPVAESRSDTHIPVDAEPARSYLQSNISVISSTEDSSQESTTSDSISEKTMNTENNIPLPNTGSSDELPTHTETRWLIINFDTQAPTSSETQFEDPSVSPSDDDSSPPLPHILRVPLPVSNVQDIPRRTVSSIASSLLEQSLVPDNVDDLATSVEPLGPETTGLITAVHEPDELASPESSMQSLRLTESDVESVLSVEGSEHWNSGGRPVARPLKHVHARS